MLYLLGKVRAQYTYDHLQTLSRCCRCPVCVEPLSPRSEWPVLWRFRVAYHTSCSPIDCTVQRRSIRSAIKRPHNDNLMIGVLPISEPGQVSCE